MNLKIFSIFDSKVKFFSPPFFLRHAGEATREFQSMVNNVQSRIGAHPEDYVLFELGDFNDLTAVFSLYPAPKSLGIATEFVVKKI